MNIRNSVLLLGLALGITPLHAQGSSAAYQPGSTQDAVSYWLPKTQLTVQVQVRKQTFKPGEFSRYAERYLRLSDVRDKAEEIWTISDVQIVSAGIPDKEHLYTLTFSPKGNRPYIELTRDGILSAVNVRTQESAAQAAKPAAAPAPKKVNPQDYMTEEILMAGSTAKMAELTAKEIYNIRESRNAITRGQADFVPTDGESLKFMLESLTAQETALLTLFSGTTETEEITFSINVTPDAPLNKQILFRFSGKLGVLPVDNLAGEPVWIDITDRKMMDGYSEPSKIQANKYKKDTPFLYYRIPGRASVRVYNNRTEFLEQDIRVAQFGNIEMVPTTIMGKNADAKITFDITTGNIKGINE
jgi:hypothetical protein